MNIEVWRCTLFGISCGGLHPPLAPGSVVSLDFGGLMERAAIEKISKALADGTRLRIFEAISEAGLMNCSEIVSLGGVTPATVSHHLKILSEAGLIACRREGQFIFSEAVPETIAAYTKALAKITRLKRATRRRADSSEHSGAPRTNPRQ
jgi:ArsR family transcriptional regulator